MGTSYTSCPMPCWAPAWAWPRPAWVPPSRCSRETLDEVGGFAAFADQLADDYEMGRAVRAKGYTLAIPAMGVGHTAAEDSLPANCSAMNCAGPAPSAWSIRRAIWAASSPMASPLP